jgi:hypothetical protein
MDIDLTNKIIVKLLTQPTKQTYKSTASDECIPGIRKETRPRTLSLLMIISKAENKPRCCQQLTKEFCSNPMDACIMASVLGETS